MFWIFGKTETNWAGVFATYGRIGRRRWRRFNIISFDFVQWTEILLTGAYRNTILFHVVKTRNSFVTVRNRWPEKGVKKLPCILTAIAKKFSRHQRVTKTATNPLFAPQVWCKKKRVSSTLVQILIKKEIRRMVRIIEGGLRVSHFFHFIRAITFTLPGLWWFFNAFYVYTCWLIRMIASRFSQLWELISAPGVPKFSDYMLKLSSSFDREGEMLSYGSSSTRRCFSYFIR